MDPSTSRNSVLYGGQNVASKGQNWNRSGTADISKWQHVVMKEEKTDLFRFFFLSSDLIPVAHRGGFWEQNLPPWFHKKSNPPGLIFNIWRLWMQGSRWTKHSRL